MPRKFRKNRFDMLMQDAVDRALPSADKGEEILDKMIALVEIGNEHKKHNTPGTEQRFEDDMHEFIQLLNSVKPIDMRKYVADGEDPEVSS